MSALEATRRSYQELADGTLRVKIDVEPADKALFLRMFPDPGAPMAIAALKGLPDRPAAPTVHYGAEAKLLRLSGFCRAPAVWRAAGTDDAFRAWIQRKPSWHSGKFSEYVEGEGRCIAAHVRRVADGAGTGHKPDYACVPLTDAEHKTQHAHGETALAPQAEWDKARIQYVEDWCWDAIKTALGKASMADVPPAELLAWAQKRDVANYLPECYRSAA